MTRRATDHSDSAGQSSSQFDETPDTFSQRVQMWIACAYWGWLPAPLWVLIASPLLSWAIGGRPFMWPRGRTRNPLRLQFWWEPKP